MRVSAAEDALLLVGGGSEEGGDSCGLVEVDQLGAGKGFAGLANLFERAVDSPCADAELLDRVLYGSHLRLHFGHQGLEGSELLLGPFEHLPDFVSLLLDGK